MENIRTSPQDWQTRLPTFTSSMRYACIPARPPPYTMLSSSRSPMRRFLYYQGNYSEQVYITRANITIYGETLTDKSYIGNSENFGAEDSRSTLTTGIL